MEELDLFKKLSLFDVLVIGLMGLGAVFLAVSFKGKVLGDKVGVEYLAAEDDKEISAEMLTVDVGGAVEKPGVYRLAGGSRLKDALVAAGGLSANADRDWVERVLNMAEEISDGEKIYIPKMNDKLQMADESENVNDQALNLVDVNTASESELDKLWGVGEARARAIIENRPYKNIDELLEKGVLPEKVFEANKENMSVY